MSDFASFIEYEKTRAAQSAVTVASNPYVFSAVKRWERLTPDQRDEFFERYIRVCAKVLGVGAVVFKPFREPPHIREMKVGAVIKKAAMTAFGRHEPLRLAGRAYGGIIQINNHPEVTSILSMNEQLEVVPHEIGHEYQAACIRDPNILLPEFREIVPPIFKQSFANYIRGKDDGSNYSEYRHQPVEEHAFAVAKAFAESFNDFMARNKFLRNPFDGSLVEKQFEAGKVLAYVDGLEVCNPYRHYYGAVRHERSLSEPGRGHADDWGWAQSVSGYAQAVFYGEYLFSHDPSPALRKLCDFAENRMDNDALNVPPRILERAKNYLISFKESERDAVRVPVNKTLNRLEAWGPLPPAKRMGDRGIDPQPFKR